MIQEESGTRLICRHPPSAITTIATATATATATNVAMASLFVAYQFPVLVCLCGYRLPVPYNFHRPSKKS